MSAPEIDAVKQLVHHLTAVIVLRQELYEALMKQDEVTDRMEDMGIPVPEALNQVRAAMHQLTVDLTLRVERSTDLLARPPN